MPPLDRPVDVPGWSPPILRAAAVAPSERLARFAERTRTGFRAAAVGFGPAAELLVGGRHFAVVARDGGLVAASHHTLPRFDWRELFAPIARIRHLNEPMIVAAGAGHANYFHWLAETVATAVAQAALGAEATLLLPGPLRPWQRAALDALAPSAATTELAPDEAVLLAAGRLSNLIGPEPGFAPHPGLLALLADRAAHLGAVGSPALYLSRLDAGDRRRMANEEELGAALAALGCEVIQPGSLPFAEQARRVRGARLVVAPHGAALATLACVPAGAAGPAVIELFAEDYLNRCFAKLAQAKGLDYCALVNPVVRAGPHHHQTVWRADVDCVVAAVAHRLGRR